MTLGQRMVWAAEYVRARASGVEPDAAASLAGMAVASVLSINRASAVLNDDERVMLADMLGVPR